jgi:acetyl esterase/lipase
VDYQVLHGEIYKMIGTQPLIADVFSPRAQQGPLPAVLVAHGGAWKFRGGNMEFLCGRLAKAGFVAVNIRYRLAPGALYPAAVHDVQDAIQWIRANAIRLGIDPGNIAAWGYSAGAHLILRAGLNPALGLKGLVAGGTPADLTMWPHSPQVKTFLGKSFNDNSDLWKEASPVNYVESTSPPVFLFHGQLDLIVSLKQMNLMKQALRAKGVTVESYVIPLVGHFFAYLPWGQSFDLALKFLKKCTGTDALHSPV